MEKIKNIEFLRIVGCIAIIFLHLFASTKFLYGNFHDVDLYRRLHIMTQNGQKAVDLFFILSGLFFTLKLDVTKPIIEFIKKKIIRLYPVLIFLTLLYLVASFTGVVNFTFYDNILTLLCLNGTSLVRNLGNVSIFWYCSAMIWTFLLFYSMIKYWGKNNANMIIALLAFFSYSFIIHAKGGHIKNQTQTFYYIFNVGMLRALGGIGVGYFIGEWYKNNADNIKNIILNIRQKLILTGIEFVCVYFIINNLLFHKLDFNNDIIFIAVFAITIILFLIKKGYISNILDNNICSFLSKYTYSFYMVNTFIMFVLRGSLWKYGKDFVHSFPILNIIIPLILIFVLGIFTYHFVEKPCAEYFKNLNKQRLEG